MVWSTIPDTFAKLWVDMTAKRLGEKLAREDIASRRPSPQRPRLGLIKHTRVSESDHYRGRPGMC